MLQSHASMMCVCILMPKLDIWDLANLQYEYNTQYYPILVYEDISIINLQYQSLGPQEPQMVCFDIRYYIFNIEKYILKYNTVQFPPNM